MTYRSIIVFVLLNVFCLTAVFAADSGHISEVGVVDMQKIFKSSPQFAAINDSLTKQFAARKAAIVKLAQKLKGEVKDYEKDQTVMDKPALVALQKSIDQDSQQLRQTQSEFENDLLAAQNKSMSDFLVLTQRAAQQVAEKKGLDLVLFDKAVLYFSDRLDITKDVMSAMH